MAALGGQAARQHLREDLLGAEMEHERGLDDAGVGVAGEQLGAQALEVGEQLGGWLG